MRKRLTLCLTSQKGALQYPVAAILALPRDAKACGCVGIIHDDGTFHILSHIRGGIAISSKLSAEADAAETCDLPGIKGTALRVIWSAVTG